MPATYDKISDSSDDHSEEVLRCMAQSLSREDHGPGHRKPDLCSLSMPMLDTRDNVLACSSKDSVSVDH